MTNALRFIKLIQPALALAGPMTMINTVLGYAAAFSLCAAIIGLIVAGIQAKMRQDHGATLHALHFAGWMAFSCGICVGLWKVAGWNLPVQQTIPTD
jgi:predicted membrane protein